MNAIPLNKIPEAVKKSVFLAGFLNGLDAKIPNAETMNNICGYKIGNIFVVAQEIGRLQREHIQSKNLVIRQNADIDVSA